MSGSVPDTTKSERLSAALRYRPDRVRLLLVAEAPPCASDRYFYFDQVHTRDDLFRYIWLGHMGEDAGSRAKKPRQLQSLCDAGVFLIDLYEDMVSKPKVKFLETHVSSLVDRCAKLSPQRIILIKATVHDAAYAPLQAAGLPVSPHRIPFPGSGQQQNFLRQFQPACEGWQTL